MGRKETEHDERERQANVIFNVEIEVGSEVALSQLVGAHRALVEAQKNGYKSLVVCLERVIKWRRNRVAKIEAKNP